MSASFVLVIAVIVGFQFVLQAIALVQLVRTPAERVRIGGRKWLWALIIILGELLGPIIWFFAGRLPEPVSLPASPPAERPGTSRASAADAVDALYDRAAPGDTAIGATEPGESPHAGPGELGDV